MQRKGIIIAIVLLAIGFSAVTTTLVIRGNANLLADYDNFDIYFSAAVLDGINTPTLISSDRKTITYTTKDLKLVGDISTLEYTVQNDSTQYDAEVSVECAPSTTDYLNITNSMMDTIIRAQSSENGTLRVELTRQSAEIIETPFTCTLNVTAIERTEVPVQKVLPEVMEISSSTSDAIWGYKEDITKVVIQDSMNEMDTAAYSFDISAEENGSVMAYLVENSEPSGTYTAYIQGDGGFALGANGNNFFRGFSQLATIEGLEYLDTSNATELESFFRDCVNLESVNLSNFDTSKVTTFYNMFSHCDKLVTADLSSFDFSLAENMSGMFEYCYALENVKLGTSKTPNLTEMYELFYHCESLRNINLSNLDTTNVVDMSSLFAYCKLLETIDVSTFITNNVTNMTSMFYNCNALTSLSLSNFNTSKVTSMVSMFEECNSLTELDLSNFNTSSVTDMTSMFYYCNSLITLNLSNFDTSSVTSMTDMFGSTASLTSLDFRNATFDSVSEHIYMFSECPDTLVVIAKDEEAKVWLEERLADEHLSGTVTIA